MIVGKLINWVIVIGVAYGSYQYLSTGDVTFGGPPKETVLKLANQANRNLGPKEHLTTGHACVRKGGGMIETDTGKLFTNRRINPLPTRCKHTASSCWLHCLSQQKDSP